MVLIEALKIFMNDIKISYKTKLLFLLRELSLRYKQFKIVLLRFIINSM
jgi:hypothetical protein